MDIVLSKNGVICARAVCKICDVRKIFKLNNAPKIIVSRAV